MDSIEYEALRRASQMQQNKTQPAQSRQNQTSPKQSPAHSEQKKSPESHKDKAAHPAKVHQNESPMLSSLFEDKEKLLILALILILSSEDSQDPALTLALLYLII